MLRERRVGTKELDTPLIMSIRNFMRKVLQLESMRENVLVNVIETETEGTPGRGGTPGIESGSIRVVIMKERESILVVTEKESFQAAIERGNTPAVIENVMEGILAVVEIEGREGGLWNEIEERGGCLRNEIEVRGGCLQNGTGREFVSDIIQDLIGILRVTIITITSLRGTMAPPPTHITGITTVTTHTPTRCHTTHTITVVTQMEQSLNTNCV